MMEFSNGDTAIQCETVGDVVDELSRLPRSLQVRASFAETIDLVIFNIDQDDPYLGFEDGGHYSDG